MSARDNNTTFRSDSPHQRFGRACTIAGTTALLALSAASSVTAQLRADEDPIDNPDLAPACGLNILMILDESGSINNDVDSAREAFKAFTSAIKNTGSAMAVAEYAQEARLPSIGPFQPGDYITVTDTTVAAFEDYIDNEYDPSGNTNWEDGLRMGRAGSAFAPRPDFNTPHLTVFVTDGDPSHRIRGDRVTDEEYLSKQPLESAETTGDSKDDAADAAIANANSLKSQGSHILVIGVGNGVSSSSSLERIQRISGPDVYPDDGEDFDVATDDVYRAEDFDELELALRDAAFQLCSPSLTISKLVDLTPDPDSLEDAQPGEGWQIDGTVSAPGDGGFAWILPRSENPGTNPQAATTDSAGFATFQWIPEEETGNSAFTATEVMEPGFENDISETACTFRTPDSPDQTLPLTNVGDGFFSVDIAPGSIVTCQLVNRAIPAPSMSLEKLTDGEDADFPPGPSIPRTDTVTWTYQVSNTGNTRLENIEIRDLLELPVAFAGEEQPTITCPKTTLIQGESMNCSASGVSGRTPDGNEFRGQYANLATVSATDSTGLTVTASDRSHYVEVGPGLRVEKSTNGFDADQPRGPFLRAGSEVTWSYELSNTGTEPLTNVTLEDDDPEVTPVFQGGDANQNGALDTDETWLYQATGIATAGQYANRALASADGAQEAVFDEDPSHYFGSAPAVAIEKSTNGEDADLPPGPQIPVGEPVTWTYVVTNTGNLPLLRWGVTDDQVNNVVCPGLILLPGKSTSCSATGIAQAGQYTNTATVVAGDPGGGPDLVATDPSHYLGAEPALSLEKRTNGQDADAPTGPFIPVGAAVEWTFEVRNQGNVGLELLGVIDTQLPLDSITCPSATPILAPGASVTCVADGIATEGQYSNFALAAARPANSASGLLRGNVFASDPSHYFGADPGISLEKFTNGLDADTPADAAEVRPGGLVEWGYLVSNTGNQPLSEVRVTDDQGVIPVLTDGDENGNGLLDVDEFWLFEASGVATAGLYTNLGVVEARDALGSQVSDSDPSHYLGIVSDLVLEKSTNGEDADFAPGPQLDVGASVTWDYVVTNNGNTPLSDLSVTDDQGVVPRYVDGDSNNDGVVDPGESWRYTAEGIAAEGQYRNLATAVGVIEESDGLTEEVQATDPSHYFGGNGQPGLLIEKLTNGQDADSPPGPMLVPGTQALFVYLVRNTGNVALTDVLVMDDQGLTVRCQGGNPIPALPPGATGLCASRDTVIPGPYRNIGTATGTDMFGQTISASDASHHFGLAAGSPGSPGDTVAVPALPRLGLALLSLLLGSIGIIVLARRSS